MAKSLQILLRDAHTAVDLAVRAAVAQDGFPDLKPWHFSVLRNLGEDGSRPSELAAQAGVTRQAITKIVDELERLDMVRRAADPNDGRGVIVRYTDRGRAALRLARKTMLALEQEYAKRVGADRWAQVRASLEALFEHDQPPA
jgi:DNA-binding MarR family transcriptional regulator